MSSVLLNLVAGHRLAADCEHFWELCRNKALPRFLAMFSRNRWNVKCPVYAKKGFYRLTSGGLTAAKCAMSARSRLNGPWMVACLGSCSCYGGRVLVLMGGVFGNMSTVASWMVFVRSKNTFWSNVLGWNSVKVQCWTPINEHKGIHCIFHLKRAHSPKILKSHILDEKYEKTKTSTYFVIMKFVKFPAMPKESVLTTYFIELGRALNDKMIETVLFKNTFLQNEHKPEE